MTAPVWQGEAVETLTGCPVRPMDLDPLLAEIESRWKADERRLLVGHHNLNSLSLCRTDATVREFYRACDICYVDGVPVLWLMRAAGLPTRGAVRFTLMDRFPDLVDRLAERGRRLFFLGGAPRTVERGRDWLKRHRPDLDADFHHGYFDDDAAVIKRINGFAPDVLLVGMGMPRQERWMLANRNRLDVGALFQAGGTLDYYAGVQALPPAWMSRAGLGGVYRLARNPRRLWRRYLVAPWRLAGPALRLRRRLR
ncbi:MAG: WecB/TagA/CpsF family glycosyltransferase [Candidatus Wenzhouxiangella sp. M2_3B_020]